MADKPILDVPPEIDALRERLRQLYPKLPQASLTIDYSCPQPRGRRND